MNKIILTPEDFDDYLMNLDIHFEVRKQIIEEVANTVCNTSMDSELRHEWLEKVSK